MKRSDISGLKGNYLMRFQIGVILALGTCLAAFNFTTYPVEKEVNITLIQSFDEDIPVIRTATEKPMELPPPKIEVTEIIETTETPEFIEKKPMELIKTVVEPTDKVVFIAPKPKPFKAIKKPVIIEPDIIEPPVEAPLIVTDEMPRFNACEDMDSSKKEKEACAIKALMAHVGSEIVYPTIARQNGIEGTVVIQFVVEKDGSISQAKIARDIGAGCGAEALRVVKGLPNWVPGKQRSRPVRVKFSLPVKFKTL